MDTQWKVSEGSAAQRAPSPASPLFQRPTIAITVGPLPPVLPSPPRLPSPAHDSPRSDLATITLSFRCLTMSCRPKSVASSPIPPRPLFHHGDLGSGDLLELLHFRDQPSSPWD